MTKQNEKARAAVADRQQTSPAPDDIRKVKIGVVGCGNISDYYLKNLLKFKMLEVTSLADLRRERAEEKAKAYGIPHVCDVDELMASPEVDLVVNLTIPKAHAEICLKAMDAGKHVFVEKPFGITREEGRAMAAKAKAMNVRIGGAPETFMGGAMQTCRKLIDDGWIGTPVAATAFMAHHGNEYGHPDPEFTYKPGAGPLLGMGPYYVTALISLLGPVAEVQASAKASFPERIIRSLPKYGQKIQVEVPTHVAGILQFVNGATATLITSYEVWGSEVPKIEIYGSDGTLSVPDPNGFGGPVKLYRPEFAAWAEIPKPFRYVDFIRGLGVAEMACALLRNRQHRANGELAYHALDVMQSLYDAADSKTVHKVETRCARPEPMPNGLYDYDFIP